MGKLLNVGYSGIFATYWMVYGVVASFSSAFLLEAGYSNSEIGIILAVASIISCVIQPAIADVADRSKRLDANGVARIATALLFVMVALLFILTHKSAALFVCYAMIMAWELSLQPLFNSLCFRLEESGYDIKFGICRGIGSAGYAILVAFLGTLVEKFGIIVLPETGLLSLALLFTSLLFTAKFFKKAKENPPEGFVAKEISKEDKEEINLLEFVKRNKLFVLLNIGVVFLFFQNNITNNYMLQIVEGVGGNAEDMGRIFSVMAFLEMPALFLYDKIRTKLSLHFLIVFASVNFCLKLVALTLANSVLAIYAAHFFHIFSFSIFLPAIVEFINNIMTKGEAVKGQALYTASTTIASIFASIFGGMLLDLSGPKLMLTISSASTIAGTVIITIILKKIYKNKQTS